MASAADGADGADANPPSTSAPDAGVIVVMTIRRVRACPSRLKTTSIPTRRRNDAARRNRPERARPLLGQASDLATRPSTTPFIFARSSEDVPSHFAKVAIISRTATATGLASRTLSTAPKMLVL